MKCPNCEKEMKEKSYWYYGISDWDMDYPATLHEEYYCSDCRIKWINGEWQIPKGYTRASENQIKCTKFICKQLGLHYEPLLKNKTWKFINDNLDAAKQSWQTNFECWCEENSDWLPEYY